MKKSILYSIVILFTLLFNLTLVNAQTIIDHGIEYNDSKYIISLSKSIEIDTNTQKNYEKNSLVKCGNIKDIPKMIPKTTSIIVTIIQIAVPVVLVVMGMLDFFKGITAQKEDEIKKGQQMFIKRVIAAALVFFVVVVVKLIVSLVADSNKTSIVECMDCFISNNCK